MEGRAPKDQVKALLRRHLKVLSDVSSSGSVVVAGRRRGARSPGQHCVPECLFSAQLSKYYSLPRAEVEVRRVGEVGGVRGEEERGRDVVDGGEGVGLEGEGSDDSGEGEHVSEGNGRLSESEEDRGVGEVESERDPVLQGERDRRGMRVSAPAFLWHALGRQG